MRKFTKPLLNEVSRINGTESHPSQVKSANLDRNQEKSYYESSTFLKPKQASPLENVYFFKYNYPLIDTLHISKES